MRYLAHTEGLDLHWRVMPQTGGAISIHGLNVFDSVLAQPRLAFGPEKVYPAIVEQAFALGFSRVLNHSFVDGHQRTGLAALEIFW